jgi:D-beta-D-heptose 7-phosphate kinase/D-beta-D-heptose 1-phosphate adenosyltransferase
MSVVFTNGCFDLIHPGHVHYLEEAKQLGDKLVVGLNEDESVSRLKGETRPINNINFRSAILAALECVDLVVPFGEDTPKELIELLRPDILVKGGDYSEHEVVGGDFVKSNGGKVVIIPFLPGYSSTSVIERIKNLGE